MGLMSMTGFGAASFSVNGQEWRVEIKSVNHKSLSLRTHLPADLARLPELESILQTRVRERLLRGSVEISVLMERDSSPVEVEIDRPALTQLMSELQAVARELSAPEPTLEIALRHGNILKVKRRELDLEQIEASLLAQLDVAMSRLLTMRETEGARLAQDILTRLSSIEHMLNQVEADGSKVADALMARLRQRVEKVERELGVTLDEPRILSELVVFSDKSDMTEEIVRARTHLAHYRSLIESDGEAERGRRLDFLTQELLRELNTLGSKCRDAGIATAVVDAKVELEKIREQIQNIA